MEIYVINLDRAPERMERMARLLDGMCVAFQRVPAVDGRTLPPPSTDVPDSSYRLSRTEVALIGSHQNCWALFEKSDSPYGVVLEDDVHFGHDFAELLKNGRALPGNFDLIKLETTPNKVWLSRRAAPQSPCSRHLHRLASPHLGSAGYIISRSGLAKLRRKPCDKPIDVLLFGEPAKDWIIYQMAPALVIQDNALKGNNNAHVGLVSAMTADANPG